MLSEDTYWYIVRYIGNKFKEYRKKSGLSLRDIYNDKEKISMAVVSELENGKKIPRFKTFLELMSLVDMPFSTVLNNEVIPSNIAKNQINNIINKSADDEIKEMLLLHGYDHKEIDEVFRYLHFLKSQREINKK